MVMIVGGCGAYWVKTEPYLMMQTGSKLNASKKLSEHSLLEMANLS